MKSTNIVFSIGIDKYKSEHWGNLNNAKFDAEELTNTLIEKYSFEEYPNNLYDSNATKSSIFSSLSTLNQVVTKDDNLIFFFAGHGIMDPNTKRGFWIPYEGTYDKSTWIENSVIKDFINDCPAKHILLIIDSCFSGTFLTNTRSVGLEKTYIELSSKKSRWIISSGSEEKVSDGIPHNHSPFSRLILKFLKDNQNKNCSISEIYNYIKILILQDSKQTPLCNIISNSNHQDGEFIFSIGNGNYISDINKTIGIPNSDNLKFEFLSKIDSSSKFASGKEILIIKSFIDECDYLILENFRFNEKNEKKILFKENYAINDLEDPSKSWELVRRFATWKGLFNFLETNKYEKLITVRAHPDVDKVENEPYSIYYSQYLSQLYDLNTNKMECLHCGEQISDNDSYLIEFDELDYDVKVGNVHYACLRVSDRIIGKSIYENLGNNLLINFDFEKWYNLYQFGQGQIKGLIAQKLTNKPCIISWNPENIINIGQYCIKINFDNGERKFVTVGKQIQRFRESEIDEWVDKFNDSIQLQKPCKVIETGINGYFETLTRLKDKKHNISFVTSYEKIKYSKQFENQDISASNDYSPLCYFIDNITDEVFQLGRIIPFLSNPEQIALYIENWESLLEKKIKVKTRIVESDFELGNLLILYEAKNLTLVINPIFKKGSKELDNGYPFRLMNSILQDKVNNKELKKGDKVNIMINPDTEKLPLGILLEDEFIDEEGELCSFFQPLEEGKLLDLFYKIPTKIMKKIK